MMKPKGHRTAEQVQAHNQETPRDHRSRKISTTGCKFRDTSVSVLTQLPPLIASRVQSRTFSRLFPSWVTRELLLLCWRLLTYQRLFMAKVRFAFVMASTRFLEIVWPFLDSKMPFAHVFRDSDLIVCVLNAHTHRRRPMCRAPSRGRAHTARRFSCRMYPQCLGGPPA